MIPSNIQFVVSCGSGSFFIFGGFIGIYHDRYGCSWGFYFGALFAFIGSMTLNATFDGVHPPVFAEICLQSAIASGGYGMVYVTALLVILKSVALRHRGKVNGFTQALWLLGSWGLDGYSVFDRAVWSLFLFVGSAFLVHETRSKWYKHRDWKYKPYFKVQYHKHFTLKQFTDFHFLSFVLMGGFMLCASYLYPSMIGLVVGSFKEQKLDWMYKQTICALAAGFALITGISIDLLKWYQRPAMFMFISICFAFAANTMIVFNMYS